LIKKLYEIYVKVKPKSYLRSKNGILKNNVTKKDNFKNIYNINIKDKYFSNGFSSNKINPFLIYNSNIQEEKSNKNIEDINKDRKSNYNNLPLIENNKEDEKKIDKKVILKRKKKNFAFTSIKNMKENNCIDNQKLNSYIIHEENNSVNYTKNHKFSINSSISSKEEKYTERSETEKDKDTEFIIPNKPYLVNNYKNINNGMNKYLDDTKNPKGPIFSIIKEKKSSYRSLLEKENKNLEKSDKIKWDRIFKYKINKNKSNENKILSERRSFSNFKRTRDHRFSLINFNKSSCLKKNNIITREKILFNSGENENFKNIIKEKSIIGTNKENNNSKSDKTKLDKKENNFDWKNYAKTNDFKIKYLNELENNLNKNKIAPFDQNIKNYNCDNRNLSNDNNKARNDKNLNFLPIKNKYFTNIDNKNLPLDNGYINSSIKKKTYIIKSETINELNILIDN